MNKKIINSLLLMLAILLLTTSCDNNNNQNNNTNTNTQTQSKTRGVTVNETNQKAIKDQFKVTLKKLVVEKDNDTLNLIATISNETNEDIVFDFSKFSLKTQKKDILKVNGTKETISANTNSKDYSFKVEDEGKVQVQHLVYAYYDSVSLGPVEVSSK